MPDKETRTVTCPECGVVRTKEFSLVRAGELRRAGDISKCHPCAGRLGGRGKTRDVKPPAAIVHEGCGGFTPASNQPLVGLRLACPCGTTIMFYPDRRT